jgi:hypothetical protein
MPGRVVALMAIAALTRQSFAEMDARLLMGQSFRLF